MIKIIDKKRYDTSKAKQVASYCNGMYFYDVSYVDETLYLTANKRWFLYGLGGGGTRWAEPSRDGNSRGHGQGILPLSSTEAFAWCQEHEENHVIEEYFADMIEEA